MRLLLDTHVLLWALLRPERVGQECSNAIEDVGNEVLFSTASVWEIAIKSSLGRPSFAFKPSEIARMALDSGFVELPIHRDAVCHVAELPLHHRDPFDRLLVSQAITEPMLLYTADRKLAPYSDLVRLTR